MPKRKDENEIAFDTLQQVLRRDAERDGIPQEPLPKPEKVPYRVKAGRKGGIVRAKRLSLKRRKAIARKAVKTRWSR
jgi:hypothetical protein